MEYKLGKLPPKISEKTYKMDGIFSKDSIKVPDTYNWAADFTWPMWCNDTIGCCTQVSVASAIKVWTYNNGDEQTLTDDDIIKNYSAESGYNPSNPSSDKGAVELDVLNYWVKTGYTSTDGNNKLYAFGTVDKTNIDNIKKTIYVFGGCYIGIMLPNFAMTDAEENTGYWEAQDYDNNIVGGHAVFLHGYDEHYFYLNTWAQNWKMSIDFFKQYCEESYILVSQDWINDKTHVSPLKENINQLITEMKSL